MTINPQIVDIVDRINDAWPYKMSDGEKVEYQDGLNGLDPKALNKTIDEMRDVFDSRPSINKIKVASNWN